MLYFNHNFINRNIWGALELRLYPWNLKQLELAQGNVVKPSISPVHLFGRAFFKTPFASI